LDEERKVTYPAGISSGMVNSHFLVAAIVSAAQAPPSKEASEILNQVREAASIPSHEVPQDAMYSMTGPIYQPKYDIK
jgi:hypothetical protein